MPHHFRTIEQFVQLLEKGEQLWAKAAMENEALNENGFYSGKSCAFSEILRIVRASNIGIVYPPPEQKRDLPDLEPGEAYCPCCNGTGLAGERESCQVCDGSGTLGALSFEPNGPRCPDCGLPVPPDTGTHICSDGTTQSYKVSP